MPESTQVLTLKDYRLPSGGALTPRGRSLALPAELAKAGIKSGLLCADDLVGTTRQRMARGEEAQAKAYALTDEGKAATAAQAKAATEAAAKAEARAEKARAAAAEKLKAEKTPKAAPVAEPPPKAKPTTAATPTTRSRDHG